METWLFNIAALLPGILIGLTFHEYAHGKVADMLGDNTARMHGRLTLNPIPHLDPLGTILLFIVQFGWAKPVPVNPYNLRGDKRRGMLLISLAGPMTNVVIVLVGMFTLYIGGSYLDNSPILLQMLQSGIWINAILAALNILPVPPLDGSKILAGILPHSLGNYIYQLEKYGMIILLGLILFGVLGQIIIPIANFILVFAESIVKTLLFFI